MPRPGHQKVQTYKRQKFPAIVPPLYISPLHVYIRILFLQFLFNRVLRFHIFGNRCPPCLSNFYPASHFIGVNHSPRSLLVEDSGLTASFPSVVKSGPLSGRLMNDNGWFQGRFILIFYHCSTSST